MIDLDALIARLEAATEGSADLDGDILKYFYPEALFSKVYDPDGCGAMIWEGKSLDGNLTFIPAYWTTSLDAALTLVPESMSIALRIVKGGHARKRKLQSACITCDWEHRWSAAASMWYHSEKCLPFRCDGAKTPALAICIAALKARRPA